MKSYVTLSTVLSKKGVKNFPIFRSCRIVPLKESQIFSCPYATHPTAVSLIEAHYISLLFFNTFLMSRELGRGWHFSKRSQNFWTIEFSQQLPLEQFQQLAAFFLPQLAYVEGWKLINLANETFGFNGWSHSVTHQNIGEMKFWLNSDQNLLS